MAAMFIYGSGQNVLLYNQDRFSLDEICLHVRSNDSFVRVSCVCFVYCPFFVSFV